MFVDVPKEVELSHADRAFAVVKEMLALASEIDEIHAALTDDITVADRQTQDILHEIEFGNFNAVEGYHLAKKIQQVRQSRREAKNQREAIAYFKKFADDHKNTPVLLAKILQQMKQVKQNQETRVYTPRTQDVTEGA